MSHTNNNNYYNRTHYFFVAEMTFTLNIDTCTHFKRLFVYINDKTIILQVDVRQHLNKYYSKVSKKFVENVQNKNLVQIVIIKFNV
jgi:hypothetical protein